MLFVSPLVLANDSQLQLGVLYAEDIQAVGLYAGLEVVDLAPQVAGYLDVSLLVSETYHAEEPVFGGVAVGLRTGFNSPVAPYAGLGVYVGQNSHEHPAQQDKVDNDDDGFTDEIGETTVDNQWMSAIYPELGMRIAWGQQFTLRTMARYMVSSAGRRQDDWFYGISFAFSQQ
ncbi:hypothetical protein C8N29_102171 [Agitococcus lubricus]|uniref:Outer membrane protein with beta-barrel domain n=2 Tax=Agitococcus lubricus TaxID=1077255 RepID=A0A2T5J2M5_9GAMM|nr:hypothetical protein C8N29_102171 [Agitococcus lubricus]